MALFVLALALAAPMFARLSEGWFGLAPCELCLWQRAPYWAAVALALAAALRPAAARWLLAGAALAAATSAMLGAFHLGVEFRWWPSPLAGCAAPQAIGATVEELMRGMAATPTKPCDEPAYLIPGLPLSMAAMNTIYGVALALVALRACLQGRRP